MAKKKKKKEKVEKNKIKKPEKKITERIETNIPGFDRLVNGGLLAKSVNLVVGGAGTGKTILAMQFILAGIKKGENGLFITFEEKKEEIYRNMKKFGWDLEKYEKEKKFIFLEYTPEKVRSMLEEGGGIIENVVKKNNIKRIVIDSITSFALLFEGELAQREASLALFDMIRTWGCTSFLTLEKELKEEDITAASATPLEFEVDGIIFVYFIRSKEMRKRFLEVLKMRGTSHSKMLHPFKITANGIVIEKSSIKKSELVIR